MTTHEKQELREHMTMRPFMFNLDDITKLEVLKKLKDMGLDTKKGSISALIRVLLSEFANTTDKERTERIKGLVQEEYIFTTKKNKRSSL